MGKINIVCPVCGCKLEVEKKEKKYSCPLCKVIIDVEEQVKKHDISNDGIVSIIKYEGDNDVFVWKHPIENFNLGTQLVVHETQEAILFKDGKALDLFGSGRYTLSTNNIPMLKGLYKSIAGGVDVFHSEIYFINLTTQMGIKWGTDSKVRMFDPISGMHLEIGASGQFNIRVENSRKLLLKLVGTATKLEQGELLGDGYSTQSMIGKFKGLVISKVKTHLAKTIRENDINILEVDEHIDEISEILKDKINEVLDEYGLVMPEFYVTTIQTPDDNPNFRRMKEQYAERYLRIQQERILKAEAEAAQARKIVEAETIAKEEIIAAEGRARVQVLEAEAKAKEMQMTGYTYQQETQRQVATAAVSGNNGGSGDVNGLLGGMVNLGVGLGVMGEVVGTVKNVINPAINQTPNANGWICPNCNQTINTPFCPYCGTKKPEAREEWDCSCGNKGITTAFCPICGKKKGE